MSDISSISFQSLDPNPHSPTSRSANIEATLLMGQLGAALQQVKDFNGMNNSLYLKMVQIVKDSQQQLRELKKQNLQSHRKCLQHIQILLFQQDYNEALAKIDQYKKMELTDMSFNAINQQQCQNDILKQKILTFEQEKSLINNNLASFQLKQQIWLKYAMEDFQDQEQLEHVTYDKIQSAQVQHFRKQFSIKSEMTEGLQQKNALLATPPKKNSKSISYLKSEIKKQKTGSNAKAGLKQNKQKSVKLISPQKRESEKRTTRKKGNKDGQDNKTSKKSTSIFAA